MKKFKVISLVLVLVMLFSTMSTTVFAQEEDNNIDLFMQYIENYYYQDVSKEDIMDAVYKAMFNSLDPHSGYFTAEEFKIFSEDNNGSFGGVGITITTNDKGYVEVLGIYKDAPADKAGIEIGDLIIMVDGESIESVVLDMAASKIRGEIGTDVILTINRNGNIFDVTVNRANIVIKNIEYEILDNNIGYLKIERFTNSAYVETQAAVKLFLESRVDGIIVDLRNNPGGLVDSVVKISDLFLPPDDMILNIDYKAFTDETFYSKVDGIKQPMVVLVNEYSASASEIFASAMQDNNRAVIVGNTTYGKGTVQSVISVAGGSGFKLTIAEYLSANSNKIDGVGVIPDVIVDDEEIDTSIFAPMNQRNTIYLGEISLNVYGMQQRLNSIGYYLVEDGIFGKLTLGAINNFQIKNNLAVTNRLDWTTINAIDTLIASMNETDMALEEALRLLR